MRKKRREVPGVTVRTVLRTDAIPALVTPWLGGGLQRNLPTCLAGKCLAGDLFVRTLPIAGARTTR